MSNSVVLITGGLGGLGSTFAAECAAQGHNLLLVDRHAQGGEIVNYLREKHPVEIHYEQCDLVSLEERNRLFAKIQQQQIKFLGLINVVGREFEGPFLERTREELLYMLHLNLEATLDLTYNVLHQRDESQRFMLVNVASLGGFYPMPYKAVYSSTKRFIINFSLALRKEIQSFGNVTVLCPGGLPTNAESMRKIFLQGFWGKMTAHDTTDVVRKTLKKVNKNAPIYIPGFSNRFLAALAHLLPEKWAAEYLAKRWRKKMPDLNLWRLTEKQRSK
jgi:uncharacterized protein